MWALSCFQDHYFVPAFCSGETFKLEHVKVPRALGLWVVQNLGI